jgi:uncharacterized protein YndB with AHSA1/START domain
MKPISLSATVDAPRERVFDFISDLSRRPVWTDHFADDFRLERLEAAGEGAGAHFRVRAPGIQYMDTSIANAERPHLIEEQGHGGRSNRKEIRTAGELTEGPGAVTTVTLTFWTEPGRGGRRWWKRRWRKALRRLDQAIEAGAGPSPEATVAGGNAQLTGIA